MPIARVRNSNETLESTIETDTNRPQRINRKLLGALGVIALGTTGAFSIYLSRVQPHVIRNDWSVDSGDGSPTNAFVGQYTPRRDVSDRAFSAILLTERYSDEQGSMRLSHAKVRLGHCSTSSRVVFDSSPVFTYTIDDITSGDTVNGNFEYVAEDKSLVQCATATASNYEDDRSGMSRISDLIHIRSIKQQIVFSPAVHQ